MLEGIAATLDPNFNLSSITGSNSSITSTAPLVIAAGQTLTLGNTSVDMNIINYGTLGIEGNVSLNGTYTSGPGSVIEVVSYPPQLQCGPRFPAH